MLRTAAESMESRTRRPSEGVRGGNVLGGSWGNWLRTRGPTTATGPTIDPTSTPLPSYGAVAATGMGIDAASGRHRWGWPAMPPTRGGPAVARGVPGRTHENTAPPQRGAAATWNGAVAKLKELGSNRWRHVRGRPMHAAIAIETSVSSRMTFFPGMFSNAFFVIQFIFQP